MTGSQALPQAFQVLGQGVVREARVSEEPALDGGGRSEPDAFQDLLSELADGVEGAARRTTEQGAKDGMNREDVSPVAMLKKAMAEAGSLFSEETPQAGHSIESGPVQSLQPSLPGAAMVLPLLSPQGPATSDPVEAANSGAPSRLPGNLEDRGDDEGARLAPVARDQGGGEGSLTAGFPLMPGLPIGNGGAGERAGELGRVTEDGPFEMPSLRPYSPAAASEPGVSGVELFSVKVSVQGQETHFSPVRSSATVLGLIANGLVPSSNQQSGSGARASIGSEGIEGEALGTGASLRAPAEEQPGASVPVRPAVSSTGSGERSEEGPAGSLAGEPAESMLESQSADQKTARSGGELFLAAQGAGEAPPMSGATVSQIVRRVVAELATEWPRSSQSASATQDAGAGASVSTGGALKVLHLQLEPADLGSVTVRLGLKDNVISLHLEASHQDTARAIERDRDALSNALKSAGYLVDGITSQPLEAARPGALVQQALPTDGQSSLSSSPQSQSGMAHSRGQSGGQSPRYPQENALGSGTGVNEGRGGGSQKTSGALYV